jgi:hypothetical protein
MSTDSLLRQAEKLLVQVQQNRRAIDRCGRVVIYDLETGEPLPGYAPNPDAEANIWIPDSKR